MELVARDRIAIQQRQGKRADQVSAAIKK